MNYILLFFIITRALLFITAQLSAFTIIPQNQFLGKGFSQNFLGDRLWYLANFDGEHYLWIAQFGYRQYENAFFPLYPFLIRIVSFITDDVLLTALSISFISSFVFLNLLYRLLRLDFSQEVSRKALILLISFPSAFYLTTVYNESLFLVFAAGAFLSARKNNYWLAAVCVVLATLTRLVGVFLVPAIFILWLNSARRTTDLIPVVISSVGFGMVMLVNWFLTKDLLGFIHVQPQFGAHRTGGEIILLPQVFFRYLKIFVSNHFSYNYFIALEEFFLTLTFVSFTIFSVKKMRPEYLLYSVGCIILPTLTGTLSSMPRYLLVAFPVFVLLSSRITNKYVYWMVVSLFLILQMINISMFVNGYWIS